MEIIKNGSQLDTKVYKKPTDTGLLVHYQSHVDVKYKHSLLITMLNRAFKLSSNWKLFHQDNIEKNFKILRKCQSKLDCLIFEMLFIRLLKPKLNKQSDSLCAKLFV